MLLQVDQGNRIEAAKRLLRDTTLSITEIAYRVGYPDITTFGKNFRKEVGVNARSFRNLAMSLTEARMNVDLSPLPDEQIELER
jgi:AraC-like DNA-binding protein